ARRRLRTAEGQRGGKNLAAYRSRSESDARPDRELTPLTPGPLSRMGEGKYALGYQQFRAVFRGERFDLLDPLFHLRLTEPGRRRRAARQRIADFEEEFVQPRRRGEA